MRIEPGDDVRAASREATPLTQFLRIKVMNRPTLERQCTGISKRSKKRCENWAMKEKTKCKLHGGKSTGPPLGSQNALTHGIYSRRLSDDEMDLLPELTQQVGDLTPEINLCRIQLRRVVELDGRIRNGEVEAGMRLSEMRQITKQRQVGQTKDGQPVMGAEPTEEIIVRKLPDTQELILKYTRRIQSLVLAKQATHIEMLEELKAKLIQRIGEVEDAKRRLQQFGVVRGGKSSGREAGCEDDQGWVQR